MSEYSYSPVNHRRVGETHGLLAAIVLLAIVGWPTTTASTCVGRHSKTVPRRSHDVSQPHAKSAASSDKTLGRFINRSGLAEALDYLRDGDILCVWKLDRLGAIG